ncbi:MAG: two-component system, OmpR family, phosphate regulon sensor histidine kinase PhoR, partial [Acidimicrobiia bacterium]|nr:two-component system, OmpR family, phosphate regulon sensor histidine kinase PhoR [Acidimicrobiia bacterium]
MRNLSVTQYGRRVTKETAEVTANAGTTASLVSGQGGRVAAERLRKRLLEVIADLNADLDHQQIFTRICKACVQLTGASAAAFLIIDGQHGRVCAVHGDLPPSVLQLDYSVDADELTRVVASGRYVVADVHTSPAVTGEVRAVLGPLHTAVLTGVVAKGQLVGALAALYNEVNHRASADEEELHDVLAGFAGVAIANASAYDTVVRAEAHHAAVIDGIADGVAVLDEAGRVTIWNTAAAELTGIPATEAIDRPFPLPRGEPGLPLEHHLGDGRWVELTASPLDGGHVVALHDISRQKALDAAKTMFVAATSHELKTPLTVIKSFGEWLRTNIDTAEPERRQMALDAIADSAEELRQI